MNEQAGSCVLRGAHGRNRVGQSECVEPAWAPRALTPETPRVSVELPVPRGGEGTMLTEGFLRLRESLGQILAVTQHLFTELRGFLKEKRKSRKGHPRRNGSGWTCK